MFCSENSVLIEKVNYYIEGNLLYLQMIIAFAGELALLLPITDLESAILQTNAPPEEELRRETVLLGECTRFTRFTRSVNPVTLGNI